MAGNDACYPEAHLNSPISLYQRDYINVLSDLQGCIEIDRREHLDAVLELCRRRNHLLLKSGWYQYSTWVNRRLSLFKRHNQFRFTQKQSYMLMNKLFRAYDTKIPIRGWQSTRDENFYQLCSSFGSGLHSVLRDLLPPETLKKMQEPSLLEAFSAERESEYHFPFLFWEELRRR